MSLVDSYSKISDPAIKYNFIEKQFAGWKSSSMPMTLRILLQVQLSDQTRINDSPLGDNRSRHIKSLICCTAGEIFTLSARIIRISAKTLCFPIAYLVRTSTASRYGIDGAIKEFWTRYSEEWFDLKITLMTFPVGVCKTWSPQAYSAWIENTTKIYLERADRTAKFGEVWEESKKKYAELEKKAVEVRNRQPTTV